MEPTIVPLKPSPQSRFFTWRAARRLLLAVVILGTLTAIFYAEENWRGRRAWEDCKRRMEAQGAVLDWAAFIPPPVPDDQNIFKAPQMHDRFVKGATDATELFKRMDKVDHGAMPINTLTRDQARSYLDWSDQFNGDFQLIREALQRPLARIDGDYSIPFNEPVPNFIALRALAQVLAKRTQSYLVLGQPDPALLELTFLHDLRRMLVNTTSTNNTLLVSAMINVAISGLYTGVIADGIQLHAWRDAHLAAIGQQLKDVELRQPLADSFRTERAAAAQIFEAASREPVINILDRPIGRFIPRGWVYQNMVTMVNLEGPTIDCFNLENGRIDPALAINAIKNVEKECGPHSPYGFLVRTAMPNLSKAWQVTGYNQTMVHLAMVTCALERYHLVTGEYPPALDALVPQFLEKIPDDIIGGQPLHYHRNDDGRFTLYSIGWNQTDDNGAKSLTSKGSLDYASGDWQLLGTIK